MWEQLVRARGGAVAADVGGLATAAAATPEFIAVEVAEDGPLPAIAKLAPAQAVAHALLAERRADPGASQGNEALAALSRSGLDAYLLKSGRVGGPADEPGSREVLAEQVEPLLDAIAAASVRWERDPDFGYLVAAGAPGLDPEDLELLLPRLLYRRADRVYEHAALVPELKRRWRERLAAIEGLAEEIVEAVR